MLLNKINGYKNISQGGIQNKQNKALQNRNEKKKKSSPAWSFMGIWN